MNNKIKYIIIGFIICTIAVVVVNGDILLSNDNGGVLIVGFDSEFPHMVTLTITASILVLIWIWLRKYATVTIGL